MVTSVVAVPMYASKKPSRQLPILAQKAFHYDNHKNKTQQKDFLKTSALAGGGMILSFSWLTGCKPTPEQEALGLPDEWFELNSYIKIGDNDVSRFFTQS